MNSLVLASQSPRRKEILQAQGLPFDMLGADIDETIGKRETPLEFVQRMAREKVFAVRHQHGLEDDTWVIGGDTVVVINGEVLGKPTNRSDALEMLVKLSGQTHAVLSSIAVSYRDEIKVSVNETLITFRHVSMFEFERYLESDEAYDKAGAYGIQGTAARWVSNINGSYFAVMGLPVFELHQLLETMNFFHPTDN